ncbi:hypothetical protein AsAng_0053910 [Aureispira anguillae]|uniref:Uncharacterized protein n=1 Tax=Aureispira anguillae TaxID=2864201 RepID=A0A915YK84_9BACT|nr:hypothetical protein AsAng_0053910 [Aureispira anguillae]
MGECCKKNYPRLIYGKAYAILNELKVELHFICYSCCLMTSI